MHSDRSQPTAILKHSSHSWTTSGPACRCLSLALRTLPNWPLPRPQVRFSLDPYMPPTPYHPTPPDILYLLSCYPAHAASLFSLRANFPTHKSQIKPPLQKRTEDQPELHHDCDQQLPTVGKPTSQMAAGTLTDKWWGKERDGGAARLKETQDTFKKEK